MTLTSIRPRKREGLTKPKKIKPFLEKTKGGFLTFMLLKNNYLNKINSVAFKKKHF